MVFKMTIYNYYLAIYQIKLSNLYKCYTIMIVNDSVNIYKNTLLCHAEYAAKYIINSIIYNLYFLTARK